jgi:cytochrome c oxidase subunit 1
MSAMSEKNAEPQNYLNAGHTVKSWLLTTDHKRIGILYLISITLLFFVGGAAAGLVRFNLLTPYGDLFRAETYNRLFTAHGVVMVFLFLIPSIPATLGNFLVPMMIGAKDLAFPRINLMSWYLYIIGAALILYSIIAGGVDTGWTFYTPYSSSFAKGHVITTLLGVFVAGFSSIFTGFNIIVTVHKLRAPGMTWDRLPLFIWSNYATSLIMILGTPVVAIALSLVIVERAFGIGIFDPTRGGDPILFQHLFWFYSHPAVYIMILPGMGVVSELIAAFSRKAIYGYKFVAFSSLAIALIGFLVWGHHMFLTGQSVYAGLIFSLISFLVAVPSAIKVFNWTADVLCDWVHRTFYHWWVDRAISRLFGDGYSIARYLLCDRAFSLHYGRRNHVGLPRWITLLVAQNYRSVVQRNPGEGGGAHYFYRFQPDVLPAIYRRIFGNASSIPRLSAGISDL